MQNENLPTEELKNSVLSMKIYHSQKLNADDIQKFLQGYTIVADNDKNRALFNSLKIIPN